MPTWKELADDSLRASERLFQEGYFRSSVNRCYYAAYSSLTAALVSRGITFGRGWNNPPHEQLPQLVRGNLPMADWQKLQVTRAIRRLRLHREDADYRPGRLVDRMIALECIRDSRMIVQRAGQIR